MRNSASIALVGTLAVLALFGLGCSPSESPVSLDKYQTSNPPQQSGLAAQQEQRAQAYSSSTEVQPTIGDKAATSADAATSTTLNQSTSTKPMDIQNKTLAFPGVLPESEVGGKQIRIKTEKGDIVFELLPKEGPKAASNFYYLVSNKFYDGLTFHRVEPGFVIQGGDPLGTGTGGPGYKFEDDKVNLEYKEGIVAMANAGPNTNGSQFFIMLGDTPLPPSYSIFGRVVSGMEVVKKIAVGDKMSSVTVEPLKK